MSKVCIPLTHKVKFRVTTLIDPLCIAGLIIWHMNISVYLYFRFCAQRVYFNLEVAGLHLIFAFLVWVFLRGGFFVHDAGHSQRWPSFPATSQRHCEIFFFFYAVNPEREKRAQVHGYYSDICFTVFFFFFCWHFLLSEDVASLILVNVLLVGL